jgi:hypothetical protein
MEQEYDIKGIVTRIKELRKNAEAWKATSGGIPAVDRNVVRILASVKMLEIGISDAKELTGK